MPNTSYRTRALAIAVLFLTPATTYASIFVPDGLSPGDTYHFAFVTSGYTNAASSNIADYNSFVNQQAELSGATTETWGINWYAIGSTETVDARDNAAVNAAVYLLNGTQVETGFNDM